MILYNKKILKTKTIPSSVFIPVEYDAPTKKLQLFLYSPIPRTNGQSQKIFIRAVGQNQNRVHPRKKSSKQKKRSRASPKKLPNRSPHE